MAYQPLTTESGMKTILFAVVVAVALPLWLVLCLWLWGMFVRFVLHIV